MSENLKEVVHAEKLGHLSSYTMVLWDMSSKA